jgi:hypothetical protein
VDPTGNVFIADTDNSQVVEVQRSKPQSLTFAATLVGQTSGDSPQPVTAQNVGNKALTGGLVLNLGLNFTQSVGPDCGAALPAGLAPGATCDESFSFTPQGTGPLSGTAVFTDNTLNLNTSPANMQTISLSGNASNPAPTVSSILPTSGTIAGGTPITIAGTGFLSGATVTLGGSAATGVSVVSSTSITAVTPAHSMGAVDVVVTNTDTQFGTLTNGYTYNVIVAAGIGFVQVKAATPQPPSASVTVTYPVAQTAGDLNIVVVGWNDTTSTVTQVNDLQHNNYLLAVGATSGTRVRQSIYYAKNIAGGANTVTVTFNQKALYPDVRILEYSGLDTVNPLDVTAGAVGTGTTANSGSATTRFSNELIFGAGTTSNTFHAPATGFTIRIVTSPDGDVAEDRIVSSTASYNAAATLLSSGNWVMQMATFRAAGQANPAPTVSSITPASGPLAGGTAVTITGTGFLAGATVTLGGNSATGVNVASGTSITATTPAHGTGAVNVTVTNPDSQSNTLTNGYTYTTGAVVIALAQVNAATPQGSAASATVAYPGAQTAGNLNIVVVGWNDASSSVAQVSDLLHNNYILALGPTTGTGLRQSIYYAKSIAAGTNSVTVKFNQAAAYVDVRVLEYSGLDPASPLDVTAGAAGHGTTASSGAAVTTSANELIFGAGTTAGGFSGAGPGFTSRIITHPDADIAEDKTVSSAGSNSAVAPVSSSYWVMQMVTFKAHP